MQPENKMGKPPSLMGVTGTPWTTARLQSNKLVKKNRVPLSLMGLGVMVTAWAAMDHSQSSQQKQQKRKEGLRHSLMGPGVMVTAWAACKNARLHNKKQ